MLAHSRGSPILCAYFVNRDTSTYVIDVLLLYRLFLFMLFVGLIDILLSTIVASLCYSLFN